jgi:hypothetical protein
MPDMANFKGDFMNIQFTVKQFRFFQPPTYSTRISFYIVPLSIFRQRANGSADAVL